MLSQEDLKKRRWMFIIDSKEAAINFYSILFPLKISHGGGIIDKKALKHVEKWLNTISKFIPDIKKLAHDTAGGPFREQDISPLNLPLELNYEERNLMLFIWRAMYSQLRSPEMKEHWIKNQGKEDYELAVKNYKGWIHSLEREGYK